MAAQLPASARSDAALIAAVYFEIAHTWTIGNVNEVFRSHVELDCPGVGVTNPRSHLRGEVVQSNRMVGTRICESPRFSCPGIGSIVAEIVVSLE